MWKTTFWLSKWKLKVTQSCPTLRCHECSPPGSSVHGILQARILEQVAISSSRGSSQPRDWTCISCIGRWVLYHWTTWGASLFILVIVAVVQWLSSMPGSSVLHHFPEFPQISCPLSQWCYLTIWFSVTIFFFCLQVFPGSFPLSQLFTSGGQSIGALEHCFHWIFKVDFLQDWLVWSCSPRDS